MPARYFGLIPAAGSSSRFGGDLPKQYRPIDGRALLSYSIDALASETPMSRVYVVHAPGDKRCTQLMTSARTVALACGGASRAESVRNGLVALRGELRDDDWLLVHDAARPCLAKDVLRRLMHELADDEVGGLLAIPVADTLKREGSDRRVSETVPRDGLWRAQTPQMFRFGVLWDAFKRTRALECTDDAQAVERLGLRPKLVLGSSDNIKVTVPADLDLAAAILSRRATSAAGVSGVRAVATTATTVQPRRCASAG
jgi:2-C-methyl-D-erythritol 4-phosphate cytidylyltransferase